jgi:unsaturated rhamnogalacturonyl hydrolase
MAKMRTNAGNLKRITIGMLAFMIFYSCKQQKEPSQKTPEPVIQKTVSEELPWSERMALSIMKRNPEGWQIDNAKRPQWDYVHGLVLLGFQKLYQAKGNQKYFDYTVAYADTLIDSTGAIATYKLEDYNIDMINAGKILFPIYSATKDPKYLKAMQLLRKQLEGHPRTATNGFWHKKRYPWQMWLDGLYMGAPFYAQYTVQFEGSANLDDVAKQFQLIQTYALDKKTGLLYHGWDESKKMAWADKKTGTSPNFWSRSLGWYAMALVDVLDHFPKDHPRQQELVGYLNDLATALVKYQDASGLWYQVTDMGDREGNYLEASGSAMFAYAFAKGANKGYLPNNFKKVAEKAFDGLTTKLIKMDPDGEIHLTQICAVAGLGGNPFRDGSYDYYINERRKDNDPKGTGPFIMAALELNR